MKSKIALIMVMGTMIVTDRVGASLIFEDNFNRADSTSLGSPQTGNAWSEAKTAGDGGALISSNQLLLTNDETATANAAGRVYAYTSLSGLTGFNTTLNANAGLVEWSFNMQQIRTDPSGYNGSAYGAAFVLAGSSSDFTLGTGYAVVYGQSLATDPLRLAKYNTSIS